MMGLTRIYVAGYGAVEVVEMFSMCIFSVGSICV